MATGEDNKSFEDLYKEYKALYEAAYLVLEEFDSDLDRTNATINEIREWKTSVETILRERNESYNSGFSSRRSESGSIRSGSPISVRSELTTKSAVSGLSASSPLLTRAKAGDGPTRGALKSRVDESKMPALHPDVLQGPTTMPLAAPQTKRVLRNPATPLPQAAQPTQRAPLKSATQTRLPQAVVKDQEAKRAAAIRGALGKPSLGGIRIYNNGDINIADDDRLLDMFDDE